jgi:ABC-type amino acid transport substrate-binding protein
MQGIRRWNWLFAGLVLFALIGAACGSDEPATPAGGDEPAAEEFPAGSTMAKIQEKGVIKVGVKYDVPLFGFKNPQSGEVEGMDVDLANLVADELGAEVKTVEAISDNRIPFLQDGTVDLVFSTMTITTDRDAEIDYSRPYYIAHGRILVAGDSDIKDSDDLNGKVVCTALDSTYETTVLPKVAPDAEVKTPDTYSECFAQLQRGSVDALVTDDVILAGFKQQDDSMKIVGPDLTTDPYGAGVKEGDTEFADFVSKVIDESLTSGAWQDIYDNWIGKYTGEEAEDPGGWTLEDALKNYPCVETCK